MVSHVVDDDGIKSNCKKLNALINELIFIHYTIPIPSYTITPYVDITITYHSLVYRRIGKGRWFDVWSKCVSVLYLKCDGQPNPAVFPSDDDI